MISNKKQVALALQETLTDANRYRFIEECTNGQVLLVISLLEQLPINLTLSAAIDQLIKQNEQI